MRALVVTADVSRAEDVERTVAETQAHFGRIDILFNNAGINVRKQPQDLSLEDWQQGHERQPDQCLPDVEGGIPGDEAGRRRQDREYRQHDVDLRRSFAPAYAASKGGIVQLTKSLALAWAADNIQVNAILPGWFDTELTEKAREQIPGLHERVLARIALGRWAKPVDMAGTAVWLASAASDYVTGIAVPVDGGYTAAL